MEVVTGSGAWAPPRVGGPPHEAEQAKIKRNNDFYEIIISKENKENTFFNIVISLLISQYEDTYLQPFSGGGYET